MDLFEANFKKEENALENEAELAERIYGNSLNLMKLPDEKFINESRKRINASRTYESDLDYKCFSVFYDGWKKSNKYGKLNCDSFYKHFHEGLENRTLNETECSYLINSSENSILRDLKSIKNIFSKEISLDKGKIKIKKVKYLEPFEGVSHSGAGLFAC